LSDLNLELTDVCLTREMQRPESLQVCVQLRETGFDLNESDHGIGYRSSDSASAHRTE
jgi:hypothetical protein